MHNSIVRVFIGFDERETVAFHVLSNSIRRHSSVPIAIIPLDLGTLSNIYRDANNTGSNAFNRSRFLVPYLAGFTGPALYMDCDMLVKADIAELFALARNDMDVMVVRHAYTTKYPVKYLGNPNPDYEKKNWSSLMLFPNCGNYPIRKLQPEYVKDSTNQHLHRFEWTKPERVGSLPVQWNWLVSEYARNDNAKVLHYTIGTPCFTGYDDCSEEWFEELRLTTAVMQ